MMSPITLGAEVFTVVTLNSQPSSAGASSPTRGLFAVRSRFLR